jgi:hypothetical protein
VALADEPCSEHSQPEWLHVSGIPSLMERSRAIVAAPSAIACPVTARVLEPSRLGLVDDVDTAPHRR